MSRVGEGLASRKAGQGSGHPLPYVIRGIMGSVVAITLVQQLLYFKASNFWIYIGLYFVANGILSMRVARSGRITETSGSIVGPLISIIGGAVLVVAYPFSAYRATLVPTEGGKLIFGIIVSAIGLLHFLGKVRITAKPVMKRAPHIFGGLEILLGLTLIAVPISWENRLIDLVWITTALIWIVPLAVYMFAIAYWLHTARHTFHNSQQSVFRD